LQELWTSRNYQKIQQNKLLVINTWGLFDFIAWAQKRAPKFVRKMKLERLRRLITDPKRNWKKVKNTLTLPKYILKYLLLKKE
jgi:UDP-N-acetyl-D-mannosaminuronic acid transferase (WecB/TagA/CpsF family)